VPAPAADRADAAIVRAIAHTDAELHFLPRTWWKPETRRRAAASPARWMGCAPRSASRWKQLTAKIWLELQALAWNNADISERLARVNAEWRGGADRGVRRAAPPVGVELPLKALVSLVMTELLWHGTSRAYRWPQKLTWVRIGPAES